MAPPKYPIMDVEVLSPTNESTDRGKKFIYYQDCPTIQEYVMVDSESIRIEVYHREEDGWKLHTYWPRSTVKLGSLGIEFPIEAAYRGTKLTGTHKDGRKK